MVGSDFSELLRGLRTRLNWSQPDMGLVLDVHHMTISKWERGVATPPKGSRLEILMNLLDVTSPMTEQEILDFSQAVLKASQSSWSLGIFLALSKRFL